MRAVFGIVAVTHDFGKTIGWNIKRRPVIFREASQRIRDRLFSCHSQGLNLCGSEITIPNPL